MNEKIEVSATDIKAKERERMTAVLAQSTGKETTAHALLATDLGASEILAVLETIPTVASNPLAQAMASIKNPSITPASDGTEETPEAIASRIASYTMEAK